MTHPALQSLAHTLIGTTRMYLLIAGVLLLVALGSLKRALTALGALVQVIAAAAVVALALAAALAFVVAAVVNR